MPQRTTQEVLEEALRLHNSGRLGEAETIYRDVLSRDPNQPVALHSLGLLAFLAGHATQGVELIRRALISQPNYPLAHANLGNMLHTLGRFDESIDACRRAIAQQPNFAMAHNTLGVALMSKNDLDAAMQSFRRAIEIDPLHIGARSNLAAGLAATGRVDESIELSRQANALTPDDALAWHNLIFMMQCRAHFDAVAIRHEQKRWWARHGANVPRPASYPNARDPERRLKIGYVSPDFNGHVVGLNILPLLSNHDRERFEITCYSNVAQPDVITQRFQGLADRWREIVTLSDDRAAQLVREDGIDILVDLSLHTLGNRLPIFARQPAPLAVSFAGYPGSTGAQTIQYRLTDSLLEPPGEPNVWFDEPLYLPSFWCYAPLGDEPEVSALPALERSVITFGYLGQFRKISDDVVRLWARVMCEVDRSRLILTAPRGAHRRRFEALMAESSIEASRIDWREHIPRQQYLKTYHEIDIALDTFPYNGHTTSLDALWMGVPTITLAGKTPVARAGVSQLTNLGLTELIAHDPDDFVRIASQLAHDVPRISSLRASLRDRMRASPICDQQGFARGVEEAFRTIWRRWCESP